MRPDQILVIGSGSLLASCLKFLMSKTNCPVRCIATGSSAFSNLPILCKKLGVPRTAISAENALNMELESIRNPTLVLSIHNIMIFSAACVANRNLRIVNFHNSLLPRHPGRNAPTWAIYEMDAETGITWHEVETRVDAGGVIAQRRFSLAPAITAIEATRECVKLGFDCFREILPMVLKGEYNVHAQAGERGKLHLSRHVPNHGVFVPGWPVEKMSAFLRALDYGAHPVFDAPTIVHRGVVRRIAGYKLDFAQANNESCFSKSFDLTFTGRDLTVQLALGSATQ